MRNASSNGWEDERLLALATEEGRIVVTFNIADFARIATDWAAASRLVDYIAWGTRFTLPNLDTTTSSSR